MDDLAESLPSKKMVNVPYFSHPIMYAKVLTYDGKHYSDLSMVKVGLIYIRGEKFHLYLPNMLWHDKDGLEQYMTMCQSILNSLP